MKSLSEENLKLVADSIRILSAEAVDKANSGHPGMPMGMAELATVLWLKHLKHSPNDPKWLARDRFVLSNGHGSMLLYSMLHLSGYDLSIEDIKSFRQLGSKTPGHPESFITPGVECTTGPLGQGVANAVGMAIAQKLMSSRYQTAGFNPFDHLVYCFAGDGCLMEGVSAEASSLAGHLGLGNIVLVYDDNEISIAGNTNLAFTEDVLARYRSYGWHTQKVDGHNFEEIDRALDAAKSNTEQPSIIAAKTIIGKGSPGKQNTSGVHGSPLGAEELESTKENISWGHSAFEVPSSVKEIFQSRREELDSLHDQWQADYQSWQGENPEISERLKNQLALNLGDDLFSEFLAALPDASKPNATRKISSSVLQTAASKLDSLVGGSADLEPSTLTLIKDRDDFQKDSSGGINIRFGVREHAMGAIMNGLSYYGGFVPFGSTFLVFSDYMRPAIRLAALSKLPGLFIFTHDSVFLGEDGPTHQPIEHIGSLRMIPNLRVFRPADGIETAVSYQQALEKKDGPSCLVLTRQGVDPIERDDSFDLEQAKRGAYSVFQSSDSEPEIVIVASGSELPLAISIAKDLNKNVRVVSALCWEIYSEQTEDYKAKLIPESASLVVLEAASTTTWSGLLPRAKSNFLALGVDRFGLSAPAKAIAEELGFAKSTILSKIKTHFNL